MAKFVPDIKTQRWVIISSHRAVRPDDWAKKPRRHKKGECPFCPGNEHFTPPEVWRIGAVEHPNKPGWKVRIIPNKYPITDIHEVIIHSPDCEKDLISLPAEHVVLILQAYRDRFSFHKKNGHIMIFCNQGYRAGESLKHSHSQLVVVPRQINLESLIREPVNNVVYDMERFLVYCPDFSQWPYETWIIPKREQKKFDDISSEEMHDLAHLIKKVLKRLARIYEAKMSDRNNKVERPFTYNYYIYHGESWYFRIIPRLVFRAGFELGTGLSVNIVDPMIAADEIRG